MAPEVDSQPLELDAWRLPEPDDVGELFFVAPAAGASRVSSSSSSSGMRHCGQKPPDSRGTTTAAQLGQETMLSTDGIIGVAPETRWQLRSIPNPSQIANSLNPNPQVLL